MMPLDGRPTRRGQRRAWRGLPTGRRATRLVETTYGRHQRQRELQVRTSTLLAALQAQRELDAPVSLCRYCELTVTLLGGTWTAPDGATCCYENRSSIYYTPHVPGRVWASVLAAGEG